MTNMTVLTLDEVLDETLANHLQSHTIPIHTTMVEACKISINSLNQGELMTIVDLPYNVHFYNLITKKDEQFIEAFKVIVLCHLEKFLNKDARKLLDNYMES